MIRCEVIKKFTLKEFGKLKDVKKVGNRSKDEFDVKDTFKCEKEMADYLMGKNPYNEVVIKVLEVEPEKENDVIEMEMTLNEEKADKIIEKANEENKELEDTVNKIINNAIEIKPKNKSKKKNKKASE